MSYSLFFLAIAPAAAIIWYIYHKDKYEPEPLRYLVLAFLIGVFSVLPASFASLKMEELFSDSIGTWAETIIYAFIVIALSEELIKFLFLRFYMYRKEAFNEPFDGIVYGVMIGMGFATFENLFYVFDGGVSTALIRMFSAVPAHAVLGVMMGYYVGKAKFEPLRAKSWTAKAFFIPFLAHGLYDFLLFQEAFPILGICAFGGLLLTAWYVMAMIREQQEASPFRYPNEKKDDATGE
jgi:RsiW-degrading membrane proteinase PrsW (M82 family)